MDSIPKHDTVEGQKSPATGGFKKSRELDTPEKKALRAARKSKAKYAQSHDILMNPPDKTSNGKVIAYTPYFTTQFGLPHSPVEGEKWVRKDGNRTLRITADSRYGVPYGSIPRLLIAWVATWQVRHPSATVIELGKNLSSFLEDELHLPRTGKYIRNVKEQLIALFTSKISVTVEDDVPDHFGYKSAQLADEIELWGHTEKQDALWGSYIALTPKFREYLLANPVPIDTRAFPILSGSPLAIDYYLWFARTMFSLKKSRLVTWAELHGQFGSAYDFTDKRGRHNFRSESKKQIETRVLIAYPMLRISFDSKGKGIMLHPSPTPVPATAKKTLFLS